MPFNTPIDVMPIWIVDRKRVGSSPSFAAAMAARSPSSISFCSRVLRAVTSAISDIANTPLNRIRMTRTAVSMCGSGGGTEPGGGTAIVADRPSGAGKWAGRLR
jgi:hypothetical protein